MRDPVTGLLCLAAIGAYCFLMWALYRSGDGKLPDAFIPYLTAFVLSMCVVLALITTGVYP